MAEARVPPFQTTTLAEQVYEYLLRRISTGAFRPGTQLRELDLVTQLGVSRTPIREALLRLAAHGLLEMTSRSAQVRRLSAEDVVHIYQVRRPLEEEAIKLACGRLTPADFARLDALMPQDHGEHGPEFEVACYDFDRELHRLIGVRSGNPILADEIAKLHDLVQLVHKPIADRHGRLAQEVREHQRIVTALKAGETSASRKALADHLRSACRAQVACVQKLENQPGGEASARSLSAARGS
jgi:DNA-binding GntR family transcriptional regulator